MGALAVLLSVFTGQAAAFSIGVGVGAAAALLNFVGLRILVTKAISAHRQDNARAGIWAMLFAFKLALLVSVVWVSVKVFGVEVAGLLVGVTAVFAMVIVGSFFLASRATTLSNDSNSSANSEQA